MIAERHPIAFLSRFLPHDLGHFTLAKHPLGLIQDDFVQGFYKSIFWKRMGFQNVRCPLTNHLQNDGASEKRGVNQACKPVSLETVRSSHHLIHHRPKRFIRLRCSQCLDLCDGTTDNEVCSQELTKSIVKELKS